MEKNNKLLERDVLNSLGRSNWREVTKVDFLKMASMIPDMEKDVAIEALSHFSEAKDMVQELTSESLATVNKILEHNRESNNQVLEGYRSTLNRINARLENPELSPEEFESIVRLAIEVDDKIADQDRLDKAYRLKLFERAAATMVVLGCGALAVLGVKTDSFKKLLPNN